MAASELLLTNGATPATPASGKSKIFINTAKKLAIVDDAGLVSDALTGDAQSQATPADPTGTANTTGLMMGLAGTITPVQTGRVLVIISGDIQSSLANDGAKTQMRYGTGTAPANAAALTGTTAGGLVKFTSIANAQQAPFSLNAVITGLTPGVAYWIDISLAAITGGTAAAKDISISAIEF